jgi:hypothetical protein
MATKSKITERVEQFRVRRADKGMVRTEVYVHIDDQESVKAFVRHLNAKREEDEAQSNVPVETIEEKLKRQAEEARQKFLKVMK